MWSGKLPNDKTTLKRKWVHKLKLEEDGQPPRFKDMMIVWGYKLKKDIDFGEIFYHVVKMYSI